MMNSIYKTTFLKKLFALIVLFSLTLGSCKKNEFLKEELQSDYSIENIFQNKGLIQGFTTGAYKNLGRLYNVNLLAYGNAGDDMTTIFQGGAVDNYPINYNLTSDINFIDNIWTEFYSGINKCNIILARIDGAPINDADFKKRIKGDAYFLRGLYYFHLVRMFGGIAIRLNETTEYSFDYPRFSAADGYLQVISDFEKAINDDLLPNTVNSSEFGRATKGAAKALLAKVYLHAASLKYYSAKSRMADTYYQSDENGKTFDSENKLDADLLYQKAYDLANEIITDKAIYNFSLLPFYGDNFKSVNDNNSESIFEVQFKTLAGYGTGWGKNKYGAIPQGLGDVQEVAPYVNALVGFQPVYRVSSSLYDGAGITKTNILSLYYDVDDSRRDWNIANYKIGKNNTTGAFRQVAAPNRIDWGIVKFRLGTLQDPFESGAAPWQTGNNLAIMRFAELYLIRAEANNHIASRSEDLIIDDLNMIRNRARGRFFNKDLVTYQQETFTPKTDAQTTTFKNYTSAKVATLKSGDPNGFNDIEFIDALILKERGLELGWECNRWYDLVRTGLLHKYQELGNTINSIDLGTFYQKNKNYVYPIPNTEISVHRNKDTFKQSPNY